MYTDKGGRLLAAAFVYALLAGVCGFVLLMVEVNQGALRVLLLFTALVAVFGKAAVDNLNGLLDCNEETSNE